MANTRTYTQSFAGGEISPEMWGRIGDGKFQSGAGTMRNFIATPQGPAENRPGFAYVNATKGNSPARLIPFVYSNEQAVVIELGDRSARFHALGKTLQYSVADVPDWIAPSGDLGVTFTTPGVITWTAHGLATGDSIRFYIFDGTGNYALPIGLRVAYTYTVQVLTADTFYILDNGVLVGLQAPAGGGGSVTNYPGGGAKTVHLSLPPNGSGSVFSSALSGLGSVVPPGGVATLNAQISASIYAYTGSGRATFQYSTDGITWFDFEGFDADGSLAAQVQIEIANLNTLQLRVGASGGCGPAGSVNVFATISSWSVDVPTGGGGGGTAATLRAYSYYAAGDLVKHSGLVYYAVSSDGGGMATPGTDAGVWWDPEPVDLSYEIPTPWAAADIFDLHYAQSGDVITVVHPGYPPYELKRLSATKWTCTKVVYDPALQAPTNVTVTASPGYKTKVSGLTLASPGVFTTSASHTLVMGDGIYIAGLTKTVGGVATDVSGFYLVNSIPKDGSGNDIPTELTVMDYDGNVLDTSGWSSWSGPATIQFGSKIFDIDTYYAVTAVDSNRVDQSVLSSAVHVINNLNVTGSYNTIAWDAGVDVSRYEVYKKRNGLWGFIGETTDTRFVDNNIAPDMGTTPPIYDTVFSGADDYPAAVGYYEQRKAYAGTNNKPQTFWMSHAGTEDNFSYSLPTTDQDRIAVTVATLQRNAIRHIVPLFQLVLLTEGSEIRVSPVNSDVLSPTTISAKPQSYVGTSNVVPCVVNNALVYCAARGGHVRELGYSWQTNGFTGGFISGDISLRAAHLFDNLTIADMTHSKSPRPLLWFVSSSGKMLGLTYVPEEQIGAWHWHDTDGTFESVCAIPEDQEDRLYAVIRRQVNGNTVRYVERMASRLFVDPADAFFVDAGSSADGTNTSTTLINVERVAAAGGQPGTRYKVTAAAPIFQFPSTSDVGDVLWVTVPEDGSKWQVKIASVESTTIAYSAPLAAVDPDYLNGVVTTQWAWARSTFSGLDWLEGKTLSVLGDGAVLPSVIVTGGVVTLARPSVKVVLGLPYTSDLGTLPPTLTVDGYGQGRNKNINKAWLRVYRSAGIFIGPDEDNLIEAKQRSDENYGSPPDLKSEEIYVMTSPQWQQDGRVLIRQTKPLPLSIVGLTLEVAIGG